MKKERKSNQSKKTIIFAICIAIFAFVLISIIIDLAAPNLAYSIWFNKIIDIRAIATNISIEYGKWVRGIITFLIIYFVGYGVRMLLAKIMERSNRAKTVMNIFSGFIKYLCAITILFIFLWLCGVNTSTLLASVGILTLVIGLGCQSLIADIVAGLFIIFEDEFQVGEIVVVDGFRGTVKEIGIRTTKIIDCAGDIKIINNSDIKDIVNLSRELSIAVCECGIEYQDSIERIETILSENLDKMKEKIPAIMEGPYYKGVSELGDSSVVIKLIAKCKEEDRYQVQRDMNRELKLIFDKNHINIPFPQIVLNQPSEKEETKEIHAETAQKFIEDQKEESKDMDTQKS